MLYISDLDGTLLRSRAVLSSFTKKTLNKLIDQGVQFSIATARSIVSVQPLLSGLDIHIPVICANGAYLADLATGTRTNMQLLQEPLGKQLLSLIRKHGMDVFAVAYYQASNQERVFLEGSNNPLIRHHFHTDRRAQDERLTDVKSIEEVIHHPLLNVNVMAPMKQMIAFQTEMIKQLGEQVIGYLYDAEGIEGWYWMSVFQGGATKGKAIQRLAAGLSMDTSRITVFGDQVNDYTMFKIAGTAVAMSNARQELKDLSTLVIGSNEEDSVVKYIEASFNNALNSKP